MSERYARALKLFKVWMTRSGTQEREAMGVYWIEDLRTHTVAVLGLSNKDAARKELTRLATEVQ
jgi:hypothetical protein